MSLNTTILLIMFAATNVVSSDMEIVWVHLSTQHKLLSNQTENQAPFTYSKKFLVKHFLSNIFINSRNLYETFYPYYGDWYVLIKTWYIRLDPLTTPFIATDFQKRLCTNNAKIFRQHMLDYSLSDVASHPFDTYTFAKKVTQK